MGILKPLPMKKSKKYSIYKYGIPSFIYKKSNKTIIKNRRESKKYNFAWIEKNLVGIDNPKIQGRALKGNLKDYWRYGLEKPYWERSVVNIMYFLNII